MSKNNPITCVNLDIHKEWVDLWVHRENGLRRYGANWLNGNPNPVNRIERLLKFASRKSHHTLNQITQLVGSKTR